MYIVYIHILHTRDIPSTLDNKYGINNGFQKKREGEGVIFYPFLPMTFISPAESNLNVKCKKKRQKQTRMLL